MADNKRKKRNTGAATTLELVEEPKKDWERVVEHARENPMLYAAAAIFIVFCILAGIFFRLEQTAAETEVATAYAEALDTEDPALRAAALEKVAEEESRWSAEALYMAGEAALQAMDYEKARACFEQVRDTHGDSEYVPAALDGLAFIAENGGDLEGALAGYRQIRKDFPASFIAQRQPLNVGRVLEKQEQWAEAKAAYEEQVAVFPDSIAAARAEQALEKLKAKQPDLFPEEEETAEAAEEEAAPEAQ